MVLLGEKQRASCHVLRALQGREAPLFGREEWRLPAARPQSIRVDHNVEHFRHIMRRDGRPGSYEEIPGDGEPPPVLLPHASSELQKLLVEFEAMSESQRSPTYENLAQWPVEEVWSAMQEFATACDGSLRSLSVVDQEPRSREHAREEFAARLARVRAELAQHLPRLRALQEMTGDGEPPPAPLPTAWLHRDWVEPLDDNLPDNLPAPSPTAPDGQRSPKAKRPRLCEDTPCEGDADALEASSGVIRRVIRGVIRGHQGDADALEASDGMQVYNAPSTAQSGSMQVGDAPPQVPQGTGHSSMALRRATLEEVMAPLCACVRERYDESAALSMLRLIETKISTGMGTLTDEQVRSRCAVMALEPTPSGSDWLRLPLIGSDWLRVPLIGSDYH